jgi:hypothetical protein
MPASDDGPEVPSGERASPPFTGSRVQPNCLARDRMLARDTLNVWAITPTGVPARYCRAISSHISVRLCDMRGPFQFLIYRTRPMVRKRVGNSPMSPVAGAPIVGLSPMLLEQPLERAGRPFISWNDSPGIRTHDLDQPFGAPGPPHGGSLELRGSATTPTGQRHTQPHVSSSSSWREPRNRSLTA